jgi:hypothetical protein
MINEFAVKPHPAYFENSYRSLLTTSSRIADLPFAIGKLFQQRLADGLPSAD